MDHHDQLEVAALFDEYAVCAFRYARAMGLNGSEADDVVAEGFLRVWRSWHKFGARADFSTWLYRIVRNLVMDMLRAESRRLNREQTAAKLGPKPAPETPERQSEMKELRAEIETAIAALEPDRRSALLLVTAEGLSYHEAAAIEGISQSALAARVFQARRAIRTYLVERGLLEV